MALAAVHVTTTEEIAAFVRDALHVGASAWVVMSVMRGWQDAGVAPARLLAAVDLVSNEHRADPELVTSYREALVEMTLVDKDQGSPVTVQVTSSL